MSRGCALLLVLFSISHSGEAANLFAGDDLFSNQTVPHISIQIPESAMTALRNSVFTRETMHQDRPEVLCTVREGPNVWTNVGVHLKGSFGSFRPIDGVPAFTLNFTKAILKQRFHGLEKISLNNSVQDPTRLSEKLCRELYRQAGVPVPRAGHASVDLNGRQLGVYVLLEGWNRQFIERYFRDPTGPLYEGPFLTDIDKPMDVAYGRTNGNRLTIPRLLAAASEPNPGKRLARLESVLDLDRFTRMLAVDMLAWNGDGYGLHANNYRIYHDRIQSRFVFMPHGIDQMLTIPVGPILAGGDGLVARSVLSLPEGRKRVLDRIREFRKSFFQIEPITRRALEIDRLVGAALAREAGSTNGAVPPDHVQAVAAWLQNMSNRLTSIDQQLARITNLITLRTGQTMVLAGWINRVMSGAPVFPPSADAGSFSVRTLAGATGAWVTPVWLEEGRYRLNGRVRILPAEATNQVAAGFRVRSERKRTLGLDWGWDSRRRADYRPGGETGNLVYQPVPASAGTNWTELACEIDLRQPAADLEIFCEVSGVGEAWFERASLKLTRITDPGR